MGQFGILKAAEPSTEPGSWRSPSPASRCFLPRPHGHGEGGEKELSFQEAMCLFQNDEKAVEVTITFVAPILMLIEPWLVGPRNPEDSENRLMG